MPESAMVSSPGSAAGIDIDRAIAFFPLVYLTDGDEVTIGRQDIDSYGIFPVEGAEVVRHLEAGRTPREVVRWFADTYGEVLDISDTLAVLEELQLIRPDDSTESYELTVRFAGLGRIVFSRPAFIAYAALVATATDLMVRDHDLVPSYHHVFFTSYYTLIQVALFLGAIPLLLLHESFHALAGRRLGIRSKLRVSRRLYYIVLETSLDGLVAVPRNKRYLPIVAGLLADLISVSCCVVAAATLRRADGTLPMAGHLLLAIAFATVLRMIWQFFFYLRTDIYVLVSTVLDCNDLHGAAKHLLRASVNRFLRRSGDALGTDIDITARDYRVAKWYRWFMVVGYVVSFATLLTAGLPVLWRLATGVAARFDQTGVSSAHLADSIVFTVAAGAQGAVLLVLVLRDRRRRVPARSGKLQR